MDTPLTNLALVLAILALAGVGYIIYAAKEAQAQIQAAMAKATTDAEAAVTKLINGAVANLRSQLEQQAREIAEKAVADATDHTSDALELLKAEMEKRVTEMIGMAAKGIEAQVGTMIDEKLKIIFPLPPMSLPQQPFRGPDQKL